MNLLHRHACSCFQQAYILVNKGQASGNRIRQGLFSCERIFPSCYHKDIPVDEIINTMLANVRNLKQLRSSLFLTVGCDKCYDFVVFYFHCTIL